MGTHTLTFDTWDEFVEQVQQPPEWRTAEPSSRKVGRVEFTGTRTFNEAVKLAQYGWSEGREKLAQAIAIARPDRAVVASVSRDVAGDYPLIPAAVAGDPMNMMVRRRTAVAANPVIRIDYNGSVHGGISAECIRNRGAALLSIVDAMEAQGYSCELRIMAKSFIGNNRLDMVATYKRAGEPLDIDRAAFALTHPSVLRRFFFALIEQHPDLEATHSTAYGKPDQTAWDDDPASVFVDGADHSDITPQNAMERLEKQFSDYLDR